MSLERFHSIDSFEALSKSRKRTRQCAQTCANQQDSLSNEEYFHCRNRSARVRCIVTRRSDREAEGARLLSEYAPQGHLGFESLLLRQFAFSRTPCGEFFICEAPIPVSERPTPLRLENAG